MSKACSTGSFFCTCTDYSKKHQHPDEVIYNNCELIHSRFEIELRTRSLSIRNRIANDSFSNEILFILQALYIPV
jgi:hypothetical protein